MSAVHVLCHYCNHTRCYSAIVIAVCTTAAYASEPISPLPVPQYSFDRQSPKVVDGSVSAADTLENPGTGFPTIAIPAPWLDLFGSNDDIDGLSGNLGYAPPTATFLLLFSVNRTSPGAEFPLPGLIDAEVPYNALDQAGRGHAAGDQYAALDLYTASSRPGNFRAIDNNTLVVANFNEGGTSFAADPPVHSYENANKRALQDNVDAFAQLPFDSGEQQFFQVYFTLTADSDSLAQLPGSQQRSGAHVFFNPYPDLENTQLYATFAALGLVQTDDIDGLIVFDRNSNGVFDSGDAVMYSLTPDSPSLGFIPNTSQAPAADILVSTPSAGPFVFAASTALGLGDFDDDVDALDLRYTAASPLEFAQARAIRSVRGDADDDGDVDGADFLALPFALTGPDAGPVPDELFMFDFDLDEDVDMPDLARFQRRFDTVTPAPQETRGDIRQAGRPAGPATR